MPHKAALRVIAGQLRAIATILDALAGERDDTLAAMARRRLADIERRAGRT